jgi:hypothetical protein
VLPSSRSAELSTVKSLDGRVTASVESVYVEYLQQRHPTATVRIRSDSEPVIFEVAGGVRALVMPVRVR